MYIHGGLLALTGQERLSYLAPAFRAAGVTLAVVNTTWRRA